MQVGFYYKYNENIDTVNSSIEPAQNCLPLILFLMTENHNSSCLQCYLSHLPTLKELVIG